MQITIRPTEHFFMAGDAMVRLWRGTTNTGAPIVALVAGVASGEDLPGLQSIPPPDQAAAETWAAEIFKRADERW